METSKKILEVKNLKKYYPAAQKQLLKAVDDVSFDIYEGETLGIVGESGCGKTTCGKTCLGMYNKSGGEVLFHGKDIHKMTKAEHFEFTKRVQMIFQDPYASLDPHQKVYDIIAEGIRIHKMAKNKAEEKQMVTELLEMVGLNAEHASRNVHEFSGGQRQRIGIARALSVDPEFLFCDEPISALDVSIQAQVINILEEFQEKFHFTYLFISHDLSMVRHISHTVGVMYLGHLIEYAQVDELYENMLHPYTKCLMSAVPVADPVKSRQSSRIILQGDVPSPINPPSGCPFRTRCSRCMKICEQQKPELVSVGRGHKVACHLYQ